MNDHTVLNRQVNALYVQDGKPTELAFQLNSSDYGKLSISDGDVLSPEASWHNHIKITNKIPGGVVGVSHGECAGLGLPVEIDNTPFDGHGGIDFNGHPKGEVRNKRKDLLRFATTRGWLHRP